MKPQLLSQAKSCFAYLEAGGFRIISEYEGGYTSFKDGFTVIYSSPKVSVTVSYGDMEFEVTFQKEAARASYLFIDHNIFSNASGLAGPMFPVEKLAPIIADVALDIQAHYRSILDGEPEVWTRIRKLMSAPAVPKPHLP